MRKLAIGIGILFLIALAMPALANGNGAVVGKDIACGIYTGDYGTGFIAASDSQSVINGNNWKLTCHGQIADTFPIKAVKYNEDTTPAQSCLLSGQITDDWNVVITPSGQVTLTCHGTFV
jgi:hypothetical protein